MRISRRQLVLGLLGAGASRFLSGCRSGSGAAAGLAGVLEPDRRRALAAACERVLPGAIAAGVPEYMDYWLAREPFSAAPDWKPLLNMGAVHLDRIARKEHRRPFADCGGEQQDAILARFQRGEISAKRFRSAAFFQRLVTVTLEGYLGDPIYGGNRNQVGWRFIGLEPCWWAPRRIDIINDPKRGLVD